MTYFSTQIKCYIDCNYFLCSVTTYLINTFLAHVLNHLHSEVQGHKMDSDQLNKMMISTKSSSWHRHITLHHCRRHPPVCNQNCVYRYQDHSICRVVFMAQRFCYTVLCTVWQLHFIRSTTAIGAGLFKHISGVRCSSWFIVQP